MQVNENIVELNIQDTPLGAPHIGIQKILETAFSGTGNKHCVETQLLLRH